MLIIIKKVIILLSFVAIIWIALYFYEFNSQAQQQRNINLRANVQESMAMVISSDRCDFGVITAGDKSFCDGGIDVLVRTNSSTGYFLGSQDDVSGASAMLHQDGETRIPDFYGTVLSPAEYTFSDVGLAHSVYAADTNKEAKWGSGTTFDDASNKYAGIPEVMEVIHTSPSYKPSFDKTSLSFILDVPQDQKTGIYSGNVIITAVAIVE